MIIKIKTQGGEIELKATSRKTVQLDIYQDDTNRTEKISMLIDAVELASAAKIIAEETKNF